MSQADEILSQVHTRNMPSMDNGQWTMDNAEGVKGLNKRYMIKPEVAEKLKKNEKKDKK